MTTSLSQRGFYEERTAITLHQKSFPGGKSKLMARVPFLRMPSCSRAGLRSGTGGKPAQDMCRAFSQLTLRNYWKKAPRSLCSPGGFTDDCRFARKPYNCWTAEILPRIFCKLKRRCNFITSFGKMSGLAGFFIQPAEGSFRSNVEDSNV